MIQPWLNESCAATANATAAITAPIAEYRNLLLSETAGISSDISTIRKIASADGELLSGTPRRTVAIAFDWISPPGISGSTGVWWMSCSRGAAGPMTTIFPLKALEGTRPL